MPWSKEAILIGLSGVAGFAPAVKREAGAQQVCCNPGTAPATVSGLDRLMPLRQRVVGRRRSFKPNGVHESGDRPVSQSNPPRGAVALVAMFRQWPFRITIRTEGAKEA